MKKLDKIEKKGNYKSSTTSDTEKLRQQLLLVEAKAASITHAEISWAKKELAKTNPPKQNINLFEKKEIQYSNTQKVLIRIIESPTISERVQDKARALLIKGNTGFIKKQAQAYNMNTEICQVEDIYQAGYEGFLIAIGKFDIQRILTVGFRSFAVWYLKKENTDQITLAHMRVQQEKTKLTWRTQARKYQDLYYSRYRQDPLGAELYDFIVEERYEAFITSQEKLEGRFLEENEIVDRIKKLHPKRYKKYIKSYEYEFEAMKEYVFAPTDVPKKDMGLLIGNGNYVHSLEEENSEGVNLLDFIENKEAEQPDFNYTEEVELSSIEIVFNTLINSNMWTDYEIGIFERQAGINGFKTHSQNDLHKFTIDQGFKYTIAETKAMYEEMINTIAFAWKLRLAAKKTPSKKY